MNRIKEIRVEHEAFKKLGLQVSELYAVFTDKCDCLVNGWLELVDTTESSSMLKKYNIKLEAALICSEGGGIIDRNTSFRSVNQAVELGYSAFTIFIAAVNRYAAISDVAYIKLYPVLED